MERPLVVAIQLAENAVQSWLGGLEGVDFRPIGSDLSGLKDDVECLVLVPESHGGKLIPPVVWPGAVRWVQLLSTGTDGYPDWVFEGVTVSNMHGVNASAVAEFSMAALLAAARRLPEIWSESLAWKQAVGADLAGASLGIVGFGAIGAEIARRASAFDMNIQAIRASDKPMPAHVRRADSIEHLFATSDHVVLALPSSKTTHKLVDAALLAKSKPGLHLVNVARGDIIDEDALVSALNTGALSLATLDVLVEEPPPSGHLLLRHPRARVSSHIAANTPSATNGLANRVKRNIEAYRSNRPLEGLLHVRTEAGL